MNVDQTIDTRGMRCPIPVLKATKTLKTMASGAVLEVLASDSQAPRDFEDYCREQGHELLKNEVQADHYQIVLRKA